MELQRRKQKQKVKGEGKSCGVRVIRRGVGLRTPFSYVKMWVPSLSLLCFSLPPSRVCVFVCMCVAPGARPPHRCAPRSSSLPAGRGWLAGWLGGDVRHVAHARRPEHRGSVAQRRERRGTAWHTNWKRQRKRGRGRGVRERW